MPRQRSKRPVSSRPARLSFADSSLLAPKTGMSAVADVAPLPQRENWQDEAYLFTYAVPEVRYVIAAKADLLSHCNLRVEKRSPGSDDWEMSDDERALAVLRAFQPKIGSQSDLLRQAAIHAEIAGESWLYGDPIRDRSGRVTGFWWGFYSTSEIKVERRGNVTVRSWGSGMEHKAPPDGHLERFVIERDWQFHDRARSVVFSVLPLMKTLVLCRQLLDSMAKRNINAGALFLPDELSFGPPNEHTNAGYPADGFDELEEELHEYTSHAVSDNTSPNRLNSFLLRGPGLLKHGDRAYPTKDLVGVIDLGKDFDGYLAAERAELIQAIARGMDIPPEILEGKGATNHWSGWNITEDFIARHVMSLGRRIVAALTSLYFRPMLQTAFQVDETEAALYRVALDPSPIMTDPDKSVVATTGWEMGIVSNEAWITHAGLDPSDMPDDDETFRRFLRRLAERYPDAAPAVLPVLFPDRVDDVERVVSSWPDGLSGATGPEASGVSTRPVSRREGGDKPPERADRLVSHPETVVRMVAAAADRDLVAALRRAGLRLIGHVHGSDPELADRLRRVDPPLVLTVAGRETLSRYGLTVDVLLGDAFVDFERRAVDWFAADVIRSSDPYTARERAGIAAAELVAQLRALAASSVDRPLRVGPNGSLVPDDVVLSALAAAQLVDA